MRAPAVPRSSTWLRRPSTRDVRRFWRVTLVLAALCCGGSVAQAQGVSEATLKAAFLLNFAKFTEWPPEALAPGAPLIVCSFSAEVSAALASAAAGRAVGQRPIVVAQVTAEQPLRHCSVLYVGRLDTGRITQVIEKVRGVSVLLVGDDKEFAVAGGSIGLFLADGRMRFAINVGAAERSRLRLDSQLLNLAVIIKG